MSTHQDVTSSVELHGAPGLFAGVPYAYSASAAGTAPDGGRLVWTAGACPLDADGAVVAPGDVPAQAAQVMANLTAALAAVGASLTDVVKSTVYVATSDRAELVSAWDVVAEAFAGHPAPSTLLGVAVLGWPGQLVEVEAVAVVRTTGGEGGSAAD